MSFLLTAAAKFFSTYIEKWSAYDYNTLLGKRILSANEQELSANQDSTPPRNWVKQEEIPCPNGDERKLRFLVSESDSRNPIFYTMERIAGRVSLHLDKDLVVTRISYE